MHFSSNRIFVELLIDGCRWNKSNLRPFCIPRIARSQDGYIGALTFTLRIRSSHSEMNSQQRHLLSTEGITFSQSIASGISNGSAKRNNVLMVSKRRSTLTSTGELRAIYHCMQVTVQNQFFNRSAAQLGFIKALTKPLRWTNSFSSKISKIFVHIRKQYDRVVDASCQTIKVEEIDLCAIKRQMLCFVLHSTNRITEIKHK